MPESNKFNYSIRKSKRTKRLHLKVNRLAEVEVVTPPRITQAEIEWFVHQNKAWIVKQRTKVLSSHNGSADFSNHPPEQINFPAVGLAFSVNYISGALRNRFVIHGNVVNIYYSGEADKLRLIQRFHQRIAKEELTKRIKQLSDELGLPFNRLFIKAQKTRWGSCSSKKNINLNRNLLFLTNDQVRYLIIHELCHTIHLNHSSDYWELVSCFQPDYKQIDKSLRQGSNQVPLWALS